MSITTLLAKVEALAARTPTEPQDIDEMMEWILSIVKHQFEAYLVDIMWESGQGQKTELRAVKLYEKEHNGYSSRPIYSHDRELRKIDSLTGWCYEHDEPVWIADEKGLYRKSGYDNLWDDRSTSIPQGTIYEYNKARICTEVCYPLRTYIDANWQRASGVLNIEVSEVVYPSPLAKRFVTAIASVIEQLQNRRLAHKTASDYSRNTIKELSELSAKITGDEPSFIPRAFVALPMSVSGAAEMRTWIEKSLRSHGIKCSWPETTGDIAHQIWKKIRSAYFGIVVSTGFKPNVLLEWGYLMGCGKPVIRLHSPSKKEKSDPFNIAGMKRWDYRRDQGEQAKGSLSDVLKTALQTLMRQDTELASIVTYHMQSAAANPRGQSAASEHPSPAAIRAQKQGHA